MPNTIKKLEKYLVAGPAVTTTSFEAYATCPAEAFLISVCNAHDAFVQCLNKFTKKDNGQFNKDSEDSLHNISVAILATLMGHFETFEKALFAGLVEGSIYFHNFDVERFLKHLANFGKRDIVVRADRLLAFRTAKAPVGFVIADSLAGWHNPKIVNSLFKGFGGKKDVFGSEEISDLEVLWQLRHSIVHTGAWLKQPDAQKVKRLVKHSNTAITFDFHFINAVARRFHRIVKACNGRLLSDCLSLLGATALPEQTDRIKALLDVRSPKNVWL
jgi:hypothetical protein